MASISSITPISSSPDPGDSSALFRQAGLISQSEKGAAKDPNQGAQQGAGTNKQTSQNNIQAKGKASGGNSAAQDGQSSSSQLSKPEQLEVQKLQSVDRQVRTHEQAHLAAAGGLATSNPSYTYRSGPDGKLYAVGGEVGIDSSPVENDPEATISKAQRVQRAALAPADPSPQDRRVAAAATSMAMEARMELARQEYKKSDKGQPGVAFSTQDSGA